MQTCKARFNNCLVRKRFYDYTGATKVSRAIFNLLPRYVTDQCKPEIGSMEINVIPDEPMVDEKLEIVITGLKPDQKVTLKSSFTDNKTDFFSSACFVSDAEGNVLIHKQPSLSGTYTGVDGMGPFWSMIPQRKGSRYIKRDVTTPQVIHLSVYDGHYSCTDCNNLKSDPILSKELRRWFLHKTVTRKEVRCGRLRGTLFIPQGKGPFPGVIDIFGGVGGLVESRAALLASKGFVSYALAYFNFDDLPKELVDASFDYLQETVTWFNSHPKVLKDSVGMYGSSKGGDISLMLAIRCPQIKAVVNVSGFPFCSFWPLGPFTDYVKMDEAVFQIPGDEVRVKHSLSADYTPAKLLKTWESNAKVLYIVGEDDQCVHPMFAQELYNHYPEDKRHNLVIKSYPKVGHLIEPPYTPICLLTYSPRYKKYQVWGGIRKHQVRAEEDSWPTILNFFKSTLSPNSSCSNRTSNL